MVIKHLAITRKNSNDEIIVHINNANAVQKINKYS